MEKSLWLNQINKKNITPIELQAWRLIEAQEITATRKLVDTYEEQIILEDLLETTKPTLPDSLESYHPLLYTPFRYPPLRHGSRFGKKTEPSLWYGSLALEVAMAEKAFYQFNFLRASEADFGYVQTPLTAFSSRIKTNQGIQLTKPPFTQYKNSISSPISYQTSQPLGAVMREAGMLAFTYFSAREQNNGMNVALFSPKAFQSKQPQAESFQSWQCITHHETAEFTKGSSLINQRICFSRQQFTVDNELPFPAG